MPPKKSSSAPKAAPAKVPAAKAAKAAAPAAAAPIATTKADGKKRAAADDASATPSKATAVSKKSKSAAPAPEEDSSDEEDESNERALLASLSVSSPSSDDANSSDEDDEDDRLATTPHHPSSTRPLQLPNSKDDAQVKSRLDKLRRSKSSSKSSLTPGVLYIGRLPRGFYETQLKSYLSQFGDVTRLRVSRNKKTGASKHYAFVEFADADVARIVQETMHNYLIDGRLLQVKEVEGDKVNAEMWVGANRKFKRVPGARLERVVRGREKSEEEEKVTEERKLKRQEERKDKLKSLGIEYEFEGYTKDESAPAKKAKKSAKA